MEKKKRKPPFKPGQGKSVLLQTATGALSQKHFEEAPEDKDGSCGIWSYKPEWLQMLANKKVFLAVFCLTSVLQGMYYTYFVSVLTTIEKLYQIQSKTTGLIMSATGDRSNWRCSLLTYYGGQGHRPKWIACGMLVFGLAALFCAAPHFLYSDLTKSYTIYLRQREFVYTCAEGTQIYTLPYTTSPASGTQLLSLPLFHPIRHRKILCRLLTVPRTKLT
ncbi:hypothetical protein CEXT_615591 [Caerostris extrusa]|uniref:Uncharacterized protein n=1 Tax=Caerostris extrusa TaxID=172846 RepID=A0AAV4U9D0_CAEEX|nr:hypothetical protein CEXT_615591 [Caerostris extrusa]